MEQPRNRIDYSVTKDGQEIRLAAVRPDVKTQQQAQIAYAKSYAELVTGGALLKAKLKDVVRTQKLWDDEKEAKLAALDKRLEECEKMLPDAQGRTAVRGLKKSDQRKAAVDMRVARIERVQLLEDLTRLENSTAEGLAENSRFSFLVAACTVHPETRKPYFKGVDDYAARGGDPDAFEAAQKFASLYYDVREDYERTLPENAYLLANGMCDPKTLALVGRDGARVDVDGNPVPEAEEAAAEPTEYFPVEDDWSVAGEVARIDAEVRSVDVAEVVAAVAEEVATMQARE